MNTIKSTRLVIVVILASVLLSACGSLTETIDAVSSAAYDGSKPASVQLLSISPRVEGCGMSEKQGLINHLNSSQDSLTMDQWLDARMPSYSCITSAEQ